MKQFEPPRAWLSALAAAGALFACAEDGAVSFGPPLPTAGASGTLNGGSAQMSGGSLSSGGSAQMSGGGSLSSGGAQSGSTSARGGVLSAGGGAGINAGASQQPASGGTSTGGASASKGGATSGGSASGGVGGMTAAGGAAEEIPAGFVKGIVGVGYGGLRIVSRDGGQTWGSRSYIGADGGDDDHLLRAVTYGKGRWLATGWNMWISDNGVDWKDHGKLRDGIISDQQIVEGLAYKDGFFYAAGDGNPSRLYRSSDGLKWERIAQIGNTVKHPGLTFRGGFFVSYGDSHTSYKSADGMSWTEMPGLSDATYCEGTFKSFSDCHEAEWFDGGFYLVPEWGGDIRRSTTGQSFETVYSDDKQNTLYRARALAEGYVAPE